MIDYANTSGLRWTVGGNPTSCKWVTPPSDTSGTATGNSLSLNKLLNKLKFNYQLERVRLWFSFVYVYGILFPEDLNLDNKKESVRMSDTIHSFRTIFTELGYREHCAVPVYPCVDRTTLFVGSTISVLKNTIFSGTLDRVFLTQPCLRTQNLKRILEVDFDPEYLSSFVMLGTLSAPDNFLAHKEIPAFFSSFAELSERVLVRSSRTIENALFRALTQHYRHEYDTREPHYYQWRYGERLLSGTGITFAFEQSDGTFLDIGNLVQIYRGKDLCAIEFGFGLETFTARLAGKGSPYAVAPDYTRLEWGISPSEKCLADCLVVARKLSGVGVRPDSGRAPSVLRKALRSACFLALRIFGESAEDVLCGTLYRCAPEDARWLQMTRSAFQEVETSIASYKHEVAHMRQHASTQYLARKKWEYRTRYGIPDEIDVS